MLPKSRFSGQTPIVRCFNRAFLLDALAAGFTRVELPTKDGTPVRCHGEHAGLHVLMPLRDVDAQAVIAYVETLQEE